MRAVIDVDTGTDDAIALIMAVNSPELEIAGITTVAGNASLTDTTRNTLRLMSYLGPRGRTRFAGGEQALGGSLQLRLSLPRRGRVGRRGCRRPRAVR